MKDNYFVPKGRYSRLQYLKGSIANIAIAVLIGWLAMGAIHFIVPAELSVNAADPQKSYDVRAIVPGCLGLGLYVYLTFVITVKRLHDLSLSGWFVFVVFICLFIPIVNLIVSLMLAFISPATNGPNQYGDDPRLLSQPISSGNL
jgi:uncharacterized membrane protein YhaH (DUF805 family)